jgi:SecD/SecF fusion protein
MKSFKYILIIVLIIIMIYSSISCSTNNSNTQKSITLQCSNAIFPKELLSESSKIMAERLKCLNFDNFTIDEDTFQSQMVVKLDDKANIPFVSEILSIQGKVNFLETFNREEVLKNLRHKLKSDCVQILDSLLGITSAKKYPDAIIGHAEVKDTFAISKFFRSKTVKSMLPTNTKFYWSKFVSESNRFELYAISLENSGINKASIEEIHVSKDAKYIAVSMTFKHEYWSVLENLTKRNIDKSIAFLVDGRVYSAPIVRSEISGGKIEITGNFTEEDANSIVAIISGGELPLDFQVK